jgi:hypothetical protein
MFILHIFCSVDVTDDGPPPLVDFEDIPDLIGKFQTVCSIES